MSTRRIPLPLRAGAVSASIACAVLAPSRAAQAAEPSSTSPELTDLATLSAANWNNPVPVKRVEKSQGEKVTLPLDREFTTPTEDEYTVRLSGELDVDLTVAQPNGTVCRQTSSDKTEECHLGKLPAGTKLHIVATGAREATLEIIAPSASKPVDPDAWPNRGSKLALGPAIPRGGFIDNIIPALEVPVAWFNGQRRAGAGLNVELGYHGGLVAVLGRYRFSGVFPGPIKIHGVDLGLGFHRSVGSTRHVLRLEPYGTAQHWSTLDRWLVGGGASLSWSIAYDPPAANKDGNHRRAGFQIGVRGETLFATRTPLDHPLVVTSLFLRPFDFNLD